jgi:N-acetylglucosaminyldiphosphoundecaprenol N-acetyl-beta-D-mannosaminyltransferase
MTSPADIAARSTPAVTAQALAVAHPGLGGGEDPVRRPAHVEFLGLEFCLLPLEDIVEMILDRCRGPFAYVVTPNAYHVVTVHEQRDRLAAVYGNAWLSLCDSQIVRRLAALDGLKLPLVTGSDLVMALLARANAATAPERRHILVVGPDAAIAPILRARYPHAQIDVLSAPRNLARRGDLRLEVACACMARSWDILLLCVGCPAQEMIAALIAARGRRAGVALCVGAAIDFVTGRSARAPRWLQRLGLEWAYRLACEPGRLWRRYLVESPKVFRLFVRARRARRA